MLASIVDLKARRTTDIEPLDFVFLSPEGSIKWESVNFDSG
jgi:hypothetical protein